tara:strand:+ start:278 stop:598 length:321 start_codon:yes stop_codon:yes gene_type:complete
MDSATNGWKEWSKHVLKELERLNDNYESLRLMNEEIKAEMSKTSTALEGVEDLRAWKSRVDEVVSPSQLKEMAKDVQSLKNFKLMAVTVWAVAQAAMGLGLAWLLR